MLPNQNFREANFREALPKENFREADFQEALPKENFRKAGFQEAPLPLLRRNKGRTGDGAPLCQVVDLARGRWRGEALAARRAARPDRGGPQAPRDLAGRWPSHQASSLRRGNPYPLTGRGSPQTCRGGTSLRRRNPIGRDPIPSGQPRQRQRPCCRPRWPRRQRPSVPWCQQGEWGTWRWGTWQPFSTRP